MPDPNKGGLGENAGSAPSKSPGDFSSKTGSPGARPSDLGTGAGDFKSQPGSGVGAGSGVGTGSGVRAGSGVGAGSGRSTAGDQLSHASRDAKNAASDLASQVGRSASSAAQGVKDAAGSAAQDAKQTAEASAASLKDQAAGVAGEARNTVSAMAEEARHRIAEIVDQQKAAGADTVAGVARAAKAAAGDLQQTSPQMARLVRSAAEGVDRVAGDIRSSDLNQIVSTLSQFGRRQPVAFFGGAVLAGFILARFLKSDAPQRTDTGPSRTGMNPQRTALPSGSTPRRA